MTLYELTKNYSDFVSAVENGDIPEEAIADTFDMLTGDIDKKIDNTACAVKNYTAEISAIDEEIKALTARKKSKEGTVSRLKENISRAMQSCGKSKVETARNLVSLRKSERLEIPDEAEFAQLHPEFVSYTPKIQKAEVKSAVKKGDEISGAHLVECLNIQIK